MLYHYATCCTFFAVIFKEGAFCHALNANSSSRQSGAETFLNLLASNFGDHLLQRSVVPNANPVAPACLHAYAGRLCKKG